MSIAPETVGASRPTYTQPLVANACTSRSRIMALILVSFVSFAQFILASAYSKGGASTAVNQRMAEVRVLLGLVSEVGSLGVLWYVLFAQARGWASIGWDFRLRDLADGIGLFFVGNIAARLLVAFVQAAYISVSGHRPAINSIHGMLGYGISTVSVVFVLLNPFFEEMIVRGYLMSEVLDLGGGGILALFVSVTLQMSYHSYQGLIRCVGLAAFFCIYSIYFLKKRRIAPVVFAHLLMDALFLLRGAS